MAYLAEVHDIWGPFLVIAPASTLHNWQQEISRFVPGLKALPYWGNTKDRTILRKFWNRKSARYDRDAPFHILVTSYQLVWLPSLSTSPADPRRSCKTKSTSRASNGSTWSSTRRRRSSRPRRCVGRRSSRSSAATGCSSRVPRSRIRCTSCGRSFTLSCPPSSTTTTSSASGSHGTLRATWGTRRGR